MRQGWQCPRCGVLRSGPSALSRWDGATKVCPPCWADEGMLLRVAGGDLGAIHPRSGTYYWVGLKTS